MNETGVLNINTDKSTLEEEFKEEEFGLPLLSHSDHELNIHEPVDRIEA